MILPNAHVYDAHLVQTGTTPLLSVSLYNFGKQHQCIKEQQSPPTDTFLSYSDSAVGNSEPQKRRPGSQIQKVCLLMDIFGQLEAP